MQINELKSLQEFQDRMAPVYQSVEGKVGKDFMSRLTSAVRAAR